jgi:type I site-specific restriction endonuclease
LLWRLHEAGRLTKPALFLCDRDELREQAYDKLARAFPKGSVRLVKNERGENAARNAKIQIATYQTLGLDSTDAIRSEWWPLSTGASARLQGVQLQPTTALNSTLLPLLDSQVR